MAAWELLAVVVSVRAWGQRLKSAVNGVALQADSQAALGAACKLTSPVPALNDMAKELALALEVCAAEAVLGEHYRGIVNVEADALSRLAEGAQLPARRRCVQRTLAPARTPGWYLVGAARPRG